MHWSTGMMNKNSKPATRKLALNVETLRVLNSNDMSRVDGGGILVSLTKGIVSVAAYAETEPYNEPQVGQASAKACPTEYSSNVAATARYGY
jgi:hypothetical protein